MKKKILIKSITFVIMSIFFLMFSDGNMLIHAEPETSILTDISESVTAVDTTTNNISDTPMDINHIQVTAQYVNHQKRDRQDENTSFSIPKILILVLGIVIICFCIVWVLKKIT